MKKLEISRLMDEYTDTEVFPGGGSAADVAAVKARVLASTKAPAQRKRMPRKKKVLLAAALAAVMLVLVGAGFPSVIYRLAGGTVGFIQDASSRTIHYQQDAPLMELEDGRLYFVLDGERTDITDLIDEETPYIYNGTDRETGMTYYIILGGTPDHYGWFQWIAVPDPFAADPDYVSIANEEGLVYTYEFGFTALGDGGLYPVGGCGTGSPDWQMFSDFNSAIAAADFQWLRAAADELGIPFIDSSRETVTTISG